VAHDHPEFVREHPQVYQRALAKNYLRYGRELMADPDPEPGSLSKAREALRRAAQVPPVRARAYAYLGTSYLVPPSVYRWWRSWERRHLNADGRKAFSGKKRTHPT
jgi:hypothetical protein